MTDITTIMQQYGWTALWYANPRWPGVVWTADEIAQFGPRWHAGVWTGPQSDLVCVKPCAENEEAEVWLSPAGWTPQEALELAVAKYENLHKLPAPEILRMIEAERVHRQERFQHFESLRVLKKP